MHIFLKVFSEVFDKLFSYCSHFSTFMAMWSSSQTAHETISITPTQTKILGIISEDG